MRIVLDTNVLVSGLLSPFGASAKIVGMVASGELCLCLDARILSEYGDVLRRPKFRFAAANVAALLDQIEHRGSAVAPGPLPASLPDPDDDPFLEAALAGDALCLVTGNLRHYPARLRCGVRVLSPAEFVTFYRKRMRGPARGR